MGLALPVKKPRYRASYLGLKIQTIKEPTMFNVILAIWLLTIGLLIYKLYLEHKIEMQRKETLRDAKSIFIG